ncbi:unnamed protein product [Trichogramma brassicae]|uniref:Uncharacterized protein n=1 Tax=Trichogramma brassicae TaxID=86971 RepID=A0A6H5I1P5_9HYME|nr:unnamed protein product [Trichogramma brassicae]
MRFDARLDHNEGNDPDFDYNIVADFRRDEALVMDLNIPQQAKPRWLRAPGGRRNGRRRRRNNPYGGNNNDNIAARRPRVQRSPRNVEQNLPAVAERNKMIPLRPRRSVAARCYVFDAESDSDQDDVSAMRQSLDEAIASPAPAAVEPMDARDNNPRFEEEAAAAGPSEIFLYSESDDDQVDASAAVILNVSNDQGPPPPRPLDDVFAPAAPPAPAAIPALPAPDAPALDEPMGARLDHRFENEAVAGPPELLINRGDVLIFNTTI